MTKSIKLIFLLILLSLVSCASTKKFLLHTNCNKDANQFINSITKVLNRQEFKIVDSDPTVGFIKAVYNSGEGGDVAQKIVGVSYTNVVTWTISYNEGKIEASCHLQQYENVNNFLMTGSNLKKDFWGTDDLSSSYDFYWNIRNELENICGNKNYY